MEFAYAVCTQTGWVLKERSYAFKRFREEDCASFVNPGRRFVTLIKEETVWGWRRCGDAVVGASVSLRNKL